MLIAEYNAELPVIKCRLPSKMPSCRVLRVKCDLCRKIMGVREVLSSGYFSQKYIICLPLTIAVVSKKTNKIERTVKMAGNAANQRIIPLEEGWDQEIKAKVRKNDPKSQQIAEKI